MEIGETLRRMTMEMEALQREKESLKCRNVALGEYAAPSHVGLIEVGLQSIDKHHDDGEEKKKIHHDLRSLMNKYKEMAWKIGAHSSVN